MRRIAVLSCLCVAAAIGGGCRSDGRTLRPARPDQNMTISTTAAPTSAAKIDGAPVPSLNVSLAPSTLPAATLTAPWNDGATIDARYTCDGEDVAPALRWTPAPADTAEIAITLTDDDSPDTVYWVIAGLDPALTALAEGQVPTGAIQAVNDFGKTGYSGPCPDSGAVDTYRFTVHYLAQQTELEDGSAGRDLRLAVNAATIDSADVTGLYSRP